MREILGVGDQIVVPGMQHIRALTKAAVRPSSSGRVGLANSFQCSLNISVRDVGDGLGGGRVLHCDALAGQLDGLDNGIRVPQAVSVRLNQRRRDVRCRLIGSLFR